MQLNLYLNSFTGLPYKTPIGRTNARITAANTPLQALSFIRIRSQKLISNQKLTLHHRLILCEEMLLH